ncbi:MAG: glycosyltransferase [Thermoplasmata archaeon]|nr:glycosyltransferase [Thermoplasmata archaeon]MCI4338701.1 glycosyltransferase [Thermoplasmata archaeon]MCI4341536.1 glycosyltransferase [Thermoplasmata archaeon]
MDSRPELSILIPAYNEERNLRLLVEFLRAECASIPVRAEFLVDVSGSTDRTPEIARELASVIPTMRVVDVGRRDGLLEALARLMALARAPLLLRADADIQVLPGTVEKLLACLRNPAVGIASPRLGFVPGRSRIVNQLHAAYVEIHHQVSSLAPKTTVFQLFRRVDVPLPRDAGLEDVMLQELVEASGLTAEYVPDGLVRNAPPSTLREWIRQQVRYVRSLASHARRGYAASPSTARAAVVIRALGRTLANGEVPRSSVILFLSGETVVRTLAASGALVSVGGSFDWEPVDGTKELHWHPMAPAAPHLTESTAQAP